MTCNFKYKRFRICTNSVKQNHGKECTTATISTNFNISPNTLFAFMAIFISSLSSIRSESAQYTCHWLIYNI